MWSLHIISSQNLTILMFTLLYPWWMGILIGTAQNVKILHKNAKTSLIRHSHYRQQQLSRNLDTNDAHDPQIPQFGHTLNIQNTFWTVTYGVPSHDTPWQKNAGSLRSTKLQSQVTFHNVSLPFWSQSQDAKIIIGNMYEDKARRVFCEVGFVSGLE